MGLISFIKEAGEKLFGRGEAHAAQEAVKQAPSPENIKRLNDAAGDAIKSYIDTMGLSATGLTVTFADGEASVYGIAPDQQMREKIIVAAGNVEGVGSVNDNMTVEKSEPEGKFYTVVKGDTLSKIAKEQYGDANKYHGIFEANKPMLSHPDKIYPGQVLRIPAL